MALWVCNRCTTKYAVGLGYCPQCTSTDHREDGEPVGKISAASGPSVADPDLPEGHTNPAKRLAEPPAGYDSLTVVELRRLIRERNTDRTEAGQIVAASNLKGDLVAALQADNEAEE